MEEVPNQGRSTRTYTATSVAVLLALAMGVLFPSASFAQERPDLDAQNFRAANGPNAMLTVERAAPAGHLAPTFGLAFNYASQPLNLERGDEITPVVDQQLALHLMAGIGILDAVQLGVAMPLYPVNEVRLDGDDGLRGGAIGDLEIRLKGELWRGSAVGLGAGLDVTLPVGDGQAFVGSSSSTATPTLIADAAFGPVLLAANLGVRIQEARELRSLDVGPELVYRAGAELEVMRGFVHFGAELFGSTRLGGSFADGAESPLEALISMKVLTGAGAQAFIGTGVGLLGGYGDPEFRGILGVRYAFGQGPPPKVESEEPDEKTEPADPDDDGITGADDSCPREAEDPDGFEDEDGCPDPDNDGDGVPDAEDECPDKIGDPATQGCPNPDPDGDGVTGAADECPDEKEDLDGFEDEDGCPDPDNDRDGIADTKDDCPDEPGLAADQGCPPEEKVAERKAEQITISRKIYFDKDKAVIQKKSFDVLDQVGLVLRTNPDITKVEIAGHTDKRGEEAYNKSLSKARAQAVRQYLIDRADIDPDRLVAVGYGSSKPIDPRDTKSAYERNRRVSFEILEQGGDDASDAKSGDGAADDDSGTGPDDGATTGDEPDDSPGGGGR